MDTQVQPAQHFDVAVFIGFDPNINRFFVRDKIIQIDPNQDESSSHIPENTEWLKDAP